MAKQEDHEVLPVMKSYCQQAEAMQPHDTRLYDSVLSLLSTGIHQSSALRLTALVRLTACRQASAAWQTFEERLRTFTTLKYYFKLAVCQRGAAYLAPGQQLAPSHHTALLHCRVAAVTLGWRCAS
jgi:hypothetical protein